MQSFEPSLGGEGVGGGVEENTPPQQDLQIVWQIPVRKLPQGDA